MKYGGCVGYVNMQDRHELAHGEGSLDIFYIMLVVKMLLGTCLLDRFP